MKTKIILATLLASSSVLGATNDSKNATDEFKHWSLSGYIFSMNDQIVQNIHNIKLGYKGQLSYNLNKNFYGKASIALFNHGKIGYAAMVGAQQAVGLFRPYAEIGYSLTYNDKDLKSQEIVYDAGTNIAVTEKFIPYVEFDNFAQKGKEGITCGASYAIKSNMNVGGDFSYIPSTKNNNADIFISYNF